MFSKTCQNLLFVIEFPWDTLKCLNWKYKILNFQFHQRYFITLHNIFGFITTTLHLLKKRYKHNTSLSTYLYLHADHCVRRSRKMLTYSDLPKLSSKQFQSRFSAYRKKNCKSEWKPIYYKQEILLDITDFCETLADTND